MVIGIDLGGTKIEGVVLGDDLHPLERRRLPTERERGYEHIVERVAGMVGALRASAPGCDVVGIGTPGSLSARDGTLKNSNTTCLNGRPLPARPPGSRAPRPSSTAISIASAGRSPT